MSKTIPIALIISSEIVRQGVTHILSNRGFSVVAAVPSIVQLSAEDAGIVDVVMMELGPSDQISAVSAELASVCPHARRVLTAADFRLDDMIGAFEHSIHGLILSGSSTDQFVGSLRLVALGETVLPGKVADYLTGRSAGEQSVSVRHTQGASGLSPRELDILSHLVNGDANKMIARRLNITEATVKVHVKTILRKLQVTNRTQAAIWATRNKFDKAFPRPNYDLACA